MDDATDKDENSYKSASWDTVAKVLKRSLTAPTAKKLKMQEKRLVDLYLDNRLDINIIN